MPWQIDGTFLRVNPDYSASPSGELWGKDLSAQPSIKIIASRHDYHDQDIGNGIAASLNLDGFNAMRADLQMGGFKIVNLGAATALNEIPTYGQIAGTVDYSDATKLLTLNDRNGDLIDNTTIDLTGIGAGVTQIDGDGTLELTPPSITGTGIIGLPVIQVGQSYSGGIQGVVIDDYGRVTQVTVGTSIQGDPDQTLVMDQAYTNAVRIGITQYQSSTLYKQMNPAFGGANGRAGVMSRDQVDLLESIPPAANIVTTDGNNTFVGDNIFSGDIGITSTGNMDFDSAARIGLPVLVDGSQLQSPNPPGVGFLYVDSNGFVKIGT